jgi:hypothetical protein
MWSVLVVEAGAGAAMRVEELRSEEETVGALLGRLGWRVALLRGRRMREGACVIEEAAAACSFGPARKRPAERAGTEVLVGVRGAAGTGGAGMLQRVGAYRAEGIARAVREVVMGEEGGEEGEGVVVRASASVGAMEEEVEEGVDKGTACALGLAAGGGGGGELEREVEMLECGAALSAGGLLHNAEAMEAMEHIRTRLPSGEGSVRDCVRTQGALAVLRTLPTDPLVAVAALAHPTSLLAVRDRALEARDLALALSSSH